MNGGWSAEVVYEVNKGDNYTLIPCYPDTCVLVDAFLEDLNSPSDRNKIQKIKDAKKFFELYNGPFLYTSPIVLAEFIRTATNNTFKKTQEEAIKLTEEIFKKEKFSLIAPRIKLHNKPSLSLPFFDYSVMLEGNYETSEGRDQCEMIIGRGVRIRGRGGGSGVESSDKVHANTNWEYITLSSAFHDLLISAAMESTSASGGTMGLQDAIVLSFARGLSFVHFVTSDSKLISRSGSRPYPDVEVFNVHDYIDNKLMISQS